MKFVYAILLAGVMLGGLANCSKGDGNNAGSNEMSASCLNGGCNSTAYMTTPGFSPAQNNGYAAYYGISCGGGIPVYSASKGAGCLNVGQNYLYQNGTPVAYVLNNQTGTFQAFSGYGYGGYGYSNVQAFRSCDDGDKCPSDQSCRSPLGAYSSAIGICYRN